MLCWVRGPHVPALCAVDSASAGGGAHAGACAGAREVQDSIPWAPTLLPPAARLGKLAASALWRGRSHTQRALPAVIRSAHAIQCAARGASAVPPSGSCGRCMWTALCAPHHAGSALLVRAWQARLLSSRRAAGRELALRALLVGHSSPWGCGGLGRSVGPHSLPAHRCAARGSRWHRPIPARTALLGVHALASVAFAEACMRLRWPARASVALYACMLVQCV